MRGQKVPLFVYFIYYFYFAKKILILCISFITFWVCILLQRTPCFRHEGNSWRVICAVPDAQQITEMQNLPLLELCECLWPLYCMPLGSGYVLLSIGGK